MEKYERELRKQLKEKLTSDEWWVCYSCEPLKFIATQKELIDHLLEKHTMNEIIHNMW